MDTLNNTELTAKLMQLSAANAVLQNQGDSHARRIRSLERQVSGLSAEMEVKDKEIDDLEKRVRICEGVLDGR